MGFKRWDLLDEHELKLMALRVFIKGLCGSIIASFISFILFKNIFVCEFSFIGCLFVAIYCSILTYKRDWLDDKIGLFDLAFPGISYQGLLIFLFCVSIALSFIFFAIALVKSGSIYSAIAFGLCVNFPTVFMLLRLNVYNNKSRLLLVGKKDDSKYYEHVFGYNPAFYYLLLGVPVGRGPLGVSFRKVLECIFLHNGSLEYSLLCFVLCLLVGSFILSPDIANKILPFEIKTYKGFFKFAIICLFLMGICVIPLID